ncbi:unnamed protein product, partial [Polarella glacialis]
EHFIPELGLREEELPPHLCSRHVSQPSFKGSTRMKESSISGKVFVPKDADCPIRRLRYVLVDAGDELQAFNAVIYPAHGLGPLPVLGIDVLSFNSHKKLLFGVDWAPMTPG